MPSFAIEAPGEANPLTERTLLHTLRSASSSAPQQIQAGTKQLQEWEKAPGYYKHLQSVFIARDLPTEVRYLAVIQLKNGIDKYWRKTATNAVSKDDKSAIRSRLISSGVDEADHRLALQNALVIAKIVRFEYPHDWPEAIFASLDAIRATSQDSSTPRLQRSLLILLHIIKELSSARIQRSRTNLRAATPEILGVIGPLYLDRIKKWQSALSDAPHASQLHQAMSESLLAIKTIRRLIIAGYEFPNREDDVRSFWELTLTQVDNFISIVRQQTDTQHPEAIRLVQKHLVQLSKFHLTMADSHAAGFVLLPSSLDLVRAYWGLAKQYAESYGAKAVTANGSHDIREQEVDPDERLSLNALLLIRACIRMAFLPIHTFRYRHEEEKLEKKEAEDIVKSQLLTRPLVEDILSTVITKLLVLRQIDLQSWVEEPEEWVFENDSESDDLKLSVRACSERVLLDICTHFKDMVIPPLVSLFHSVANLDNENVLFKDAVYTAAGIAAPMLRQHLDFDEVLKTTLIHEVQKQKEGYSILRRRIAILTGQWIVVNVAEDSRPLIYQMFDYLLQTGNEYNDEVVRITAGWQFRNIADDFEFKAKDFAPYAEAIIARLMGLIEEVDQTGTKMALLEAISVLIERFDHHISPYSERIVEILPSLWEQSGDEHLMKQSILTLLARLVNALKRESARFHAMLIPIIQSTVQPDSDLSAFLLEEALDLWHAILVQSTSPISPDLLSLVEHIFPLLDTASDILRETLQIVESYILLAPSDMLSEPIRKPLLISFTALIGPKSKPDANGMVCTATELLIRLAENLGGEAGVKTLLSDLIDSGLLGALLAGLRSAWTAHCTTGPLAKVPAVDGVVETDYFSILARIILASPTAFVQAARYTPLSTLSDGDGESSGTVAPADPLPEGDALKWLLEEWFAHLDNVGDPARRKLSCLALTALLDIDDPTPVLANLQLLMTLWTSVVVELCERDPAASAAEGGVADIDREGDSLVYSDPAQLVLVAEGAVEAPEDERRRGVSWTDRVHRVGTPVVVREALGRVVQRVGGEERFREDWLVNVDAEVVAAFGRLGIM